MSKENDANYWKTRYMLLQAKADKLADICEELLSIETDNDIGATWEKTNLESYETGDPLYRAEKTRGELVVYKNQLKALTKYRRMDGVEA